MLALEKYFDIAFSEPDGIKKLRKLILSFAIQGRLVSQSLNDKPASYLLSAFELEKEIFFKTKRINKRKLEKPILKKDHPFQLPQGWEFTRLIDLGSWAIGSGLPHSIQGLSSDDVLLCKVSDMNLNGNEKYILKTNNSVSFDVVLKNRLSISEANTVIFPKIGGAIATNKRRILTRPTVIDNNCLGIKPWSNIDEDWFYLLLTSLDFSKYQSGTSIPAIGQSVIGDIVVGLPPLDEQKRIVLKVNSLMSLCDELENLFYEKEAKLMNVHRSAINSLMNPGLENAFESSWKFIIKYFPELYSKKENAIELRKAVSQLAVMGKLVPRSINDKPTSELIKQLELEKQKLVKAEKMKKQKPLPPVSKEEIPFQIPQKWEWIRLGEIISILGDGLHGTPEYDDNGPYFFINGNNLIDGKIEIKNNTKRVSEEEYLKHKKKLTDRTVFVSINGTLGNVAFYDNEKVILGKSACYFNLLNGVEKEYIKILISSNYFQTYLSETATGTTIKNASLKSMREFAVPLPSHQEQINIVTKVKHLLLLCENLEESIDKVHELRTSLLDAIVS